jgi:hypothetical protein
MSNAVDIAKIHDTIYSWIASRSLVDNQHIFLEDPNIDRPEPPSISYKIISGPSRVGSQDDIETILNPDDSTTERVSGERLFTVSIKCYGPASLQDASNLYDSLELWTVQQLFQKNNIAYRTSDGVRDISLVIETGVEERHTFDLIIGATSIQTTDEQGEIDEIEMTKKIDNEAGETVEESTDTIVKP